MKLDGVELHRVVLPLVRPFRSSAGMETEREVLLVRIAGPDAEGWGECSAFSSPYYSAEYTAGAADVIARFLAPALWRLPDVTADAVASALAGTRGHLMAKAALEMAVLDAELRLAGRCLADHLGAVRDEVEVGVSVGIVGSVAELLDVVEGYLVDGYRRIKLKVAPGWDVEPVRAVRERFGPDLALQVDANGAYRLDDASHLAGLDPFGLLLIEQPLPEDDWRGHAALARRLRTPICLDEPITSARAAEDALAAGACSVVNVKPGRVGGYLEARRVHDVCVAHGAAAWCGGMLETGLARSANLALAALPGFTLPGDISASDRYFATDLTPPLVLGQGRLAVPRGPGIGTTPDAGALRAFTVDRRWLPAGHP